MNLAHRLDLSTNGLHLFIVSLLVIVCIGLLLGFLTPFLTIVACAVALLDLFFTDQATNVVYLLRMLTSGALFFLGPGAYSIDARLFGLRVAVVPPRKSKDQLQP